MAIFDEADIPKLVGALVSLDANSESDAQLPSVIMGELESPDDDRLKDWLSELEFPGRTSDRDLLKSHVDWNSMLRMWQTEDAVKTNAAATGGALDVAGTRGGRAAAVADKESLSSVDSSVANIAPAPESAAAEAAPESSTESTTKRPWPPTEPERFAAVKAVLIERIEQGHSATAAEIQDEFARVGEKRIKEILDTLVMLGVAQEVDGKFSHMV